VRSQFTTQSCKIAALTEKEKDVRTPTYSEAVRTGLQKAPNTQKAITTPIRSSSSSSPSSSSGSSGVPLLLAARVDERAVSIDTGRAKAEKADFAVVKERL
jgi:hypothetical protein